MQNARLSFLLLFLAFTANAQPGTPGRRALVSDSIAASVREAEAAGGRGLRVVPNNPSDSSVESEVGGTHDRRCVDVDQISIARSGDFVAGPFSYYNELWHAGWAKVWWRPAFVASPSATLAVRASRLDAVADGIVFEQPFITFGVDHSGNNLGGPKFYPSGFRVPTTGRWMLVATAGANWGCFVLTVR